MTQKYTEAKREANARYDSKTYRKYTFSLRIDDDKHIINDLDRAKEQGQTSREWLNDLFLRANK